MHLAELNIARAKAELDDPLMKDFNDNLDPINALAEASPGFVWRLKDEQGNATSIQLFDDPLVIVNLSVWQDLASLRQFMFKTHHLDFLKRKAEWFQAADQSTYVLWWVPEGHIPSTDEAIQRLEHLRTHGESPHAFSFRSRFTPADLC